MSNGDWIKHAAIGLIIIALGCVWAAFYVGSEIGKARGESNKHTAEYERHAEDKIRSTCLNGQGGDIAECVSKVIQATNEDQRAQSDLIAQTEMARWAFYMLIATVGMAIITGAGVYYVWRTLAVTREIGEKQARAYLSLSVDTVSVEVSILSDRKVVVWELSVLIKNSGHSPAQNACLSIKNTQSGESNGEISAGDISSGEETPITYMLPASFDAAKARGGKGNDFGTDILVSLFYTDVFDKTEEIGPIGYMVFGDFGNPSRNKSVKVRPHNITVAQIPKNGA